MPLSSKQIQQIAERCPAWERESWPHLELELIVRLTPISDRFSSLLRDEDTRDDFITWLIRDFLRRAREGTLFIDDGMSYPDPLAKLITPAFVRFKIISFLRRKRRLMFLGEHDDEITPIRGMTGSLGSSRLDTLVQQAGAQLENMTLAVDAEGQVDRIQETAGLQLFPRLEWSKPSLSSLLHCLQMELARANPKAINPLIRLREFHCRAKQRIDEEKARLLGKLGGDARGATPRQREALARRLDQLDVDATFQPLSSADLVELLDIGMADAAKRRYRYFQALRYLLPELARLWKDMDELP